jgi:diaminohydroxyphosphoribosylaminopyrimidine deaminase / 5-amino-6-(5-phosphoribosylamino)uracil reductase
MYCRSNDFDKDIPLFAVEGREVFIEDSLDKINIYKNILIEGGPAMMEATKEIVDRYLCFLAPTSGGKTAFVNEAIDLKILNTRQLDNDLMIWMGKRGR